MIIKKIKNYKNSNWIKRFYKHFKKMIQIKNYKNKIFVVQTNKKGILNLNLKNLKKNNIL